MRNKFKFKNTSTWIAISGLLLAGTLVLSGCVLSSPTEDESNINIDEPVDTTELDTDQPDSTDWGSFIIDGVDEALIGTWKLDGEYVVGQKNVFKGRELTITSTGNYTEDYSVEEQSLEDTGLEALGDSITVPTDSGDISIDLPTCTVTGMTTGNLWNEVNVDLDAYEQLQKAAEANGENPDDVTVPVEHLLLVQRGDDITPRNVDCPSPLTGQNVEGNFPTSPLGTGVAQFPTLPDDSSTIDLDAVYVQYSYTLDADWQTLTISSTSGPDVEWEFTRVSF